MHCTCMLYKEGATQGDHALAMAMYVIGIPLIPRLNSIAK